MIGIGIIGCGRIAQERHLPEYAQNQHAQVIGVYDLNGARAKAIAKEYGVKCYADLEDLLGDQRIDAVSVCSANTAHAQHTIRALRAGKHVLCEKPMAMTRRDCEEMVSVATEQDQFLMVDQNQRLAAGHIKGRELIETGEIGKVLTFMTTFGHGGPETWTIDPGKDIWFFDKKRAVMGVLADLGIHKVDLVQYLIAQNVTEVTAMLSTLDKKRVDGSMIDVDDNAICLLRTDAGVIGTMRASWTYYAKEDNATIIYGTDGELRLYDDPIHSVILHKKGQEPVFYDVDAIQTNDKQTKSGVIDAFVAGIIEPAKREMTGESVLSAMRAVFACVESSLSGRMVKIDVSGRDEK